MRTSIIGTAGRKDDAPRMSKELYGRMYRKLLEDGFHPTLVSGGAAWADHLAVSLFLAGKAEHLILHLPAKWIGGGYEITRDGHTANYYHTQFSKVVGASTLGGIDRAIAQGAEIHIHDGFLARNMKVAASEDIRAFTFGTKSSLWNGEGKRPSAFEAGLKNGGTSHTWDRASAAKKMVHYCLPL